MLFSVRGSVRGCRRDRDGDKAGGGEGARALAQLLTLMDGFHGTDGSSHVVVVGATNRYCRCMCDLYFASTGSPTRHDLRRPSHAVGHCLAEHWTAHVLPV